MRINAGIYIENNVSYTTKEFKKKLYLGCPINAVMHFSKFDYDEILIVNKTEFVNSFDILNLKKISEASLKPKCYAGGIREIVQAKTVIEVGFERVSLRSLYFSDLYEYRGIIKLLGRQSVTLCLDIIQKNKDYFISVDHNTFINLQDFNIDNQDLPGEIFINFINSNGCLTGLDIDLLILIASKKWLTNINYCGGISKMSDIKTLEQHNFTAATVFTCAATINYGSNKLLNNSIFHE